MHRKKLQKQNNLNFLIYKNQNTIRKMNNEESCIEESRYIESRVELFCTLYVPSGMLEADEYYDDVKLRDFFGCESQQYVKDGLWEYRDELLSRGFIEQPCLWLGGKMCFPVKENFVECREVRRERKGEE